MSRIKKCLISLFVWGIGSIVLFGLLRASNPTTGQPNFQLRSKATMTRFLMSIKPRYPKGIGKKRYYIDFRVQDKMSRYINAGDYFFLKPLETIETKVDPKEGLVICFYRETTKAKLGEYRIERQPVGKTFYLTLGRKKKKKLFGPDEFEDPRIYPQTGPVYGVLGKTEVGRYSLKNNVVREQVKEEIPLGEKIPDIPWLGVPSVIAK